MLRALTLNCQKSHKKRQLLDFIEKITETAIYDILFLQETSKDLIKTVNSQLLQDYYKIITTPNKKMATILRTDRFQINKTKTLPIKKNSTHNILITKVKYNQQSLYLINIHNVAQLQGIFTRLQTLHKLKNELRQELIEQNTSYIMAGDLNTLVPFEYLITKILLYPISLQSPPFKTYSGRAIERTSISNKVVYYFTNHVKNIQMRLDFFSTNLSIANITRILPPGQISDHAPIMLTIDTTSSIIA